MKRRRIKEADDMQREKIETDMRLEDVNMTSAAGQEVADTSERKESLAERLGLEKGAWHPGPEHEATVKEWLKWATRKFEEVAGEDGQVDRHEFKEAFRIKDVRFVAIRSTCTIYTTCAVIYVIVIAEVVRVQFSTNEHLF